MTNSKFNNVKYWENRFYQCDADHEDEVYYQELVALVRKESQERDTISQETFKKILKWKDRRERVIQKVKWADYKRTYIPRLKLLISGTIADHNKIYILTWDADKLKEKLPVLPEVLKNILDKASGCGVPVSSTILHFLFPDAFPIIDIRTAETLYYWSKIKSPDRNDPHKYHEFRSVLLKAKQDTTVALHSLDRALFAYHREFLEPAMAKVYKQKNSDNISMEVPWKTRGMVIDDLKLRSPTIKTIF